VPVQDRVRIGEAVEEHGGPIPLGALAARVALSTLIILGIVAVVATVWAGRIVVALLFFAIIIASAIRPGVDALKRRRVPRGVGVLLHYAVLVALLAGALWLAIPAATAGSWCAA